MDDATMTVPIQLNANELRLVRTALEMLEDTLGHEEAEELDEVQALLERLPKAAREA